MATLNEVKARIQGVKNTQKITRAMKIVAATKLRKNERVQRSLKPYSAEIEAVLQEIAIYDRPDIHPLLAPKKRVKRIGTIVIASDRGLCGAFNGNLFRKTQEVFDLEWRKDKENVLYLIGLKALRYFSRQALKIGYEKTRVEKTDRRNLAKEYAEKIAQDYLDGEIDEVRIIYNQFRSAGSFGFQEKQFLPIRVEGNKKKDVEFIYENSYREVLETVIPYYLENVLLQCVLESAASEEASRMVAMDYATENAQTLIGELTLFYNRTRQAVITREISEIVGGAEALKKR